MKGKTKKILAGLGLGLMMGTTALLGTGCTSDAQISQSDFDALIKKSQSTMEAIENYTSDANTYMENMNNYVTRDQEYSQDYILLKLKGYIYDGLSGKYDNKCIEMNSVYNSLDRFGNNLYNYDATEKHFTKDGLTKMLFEYSDVHYDEFQYYEVNYVEEQGYYITGYVDGGSSKKSKEKIPTYLVKDLSKTDEDSNIPSMISSMYNYSDLMRHFNTLYTYDWSLKVIDGKEIFSAYDDDKFYELGFTNGVLSSYKIFEYRKNDSGLIDYYWEYIITIALSDEDFVVDVSDFTVKSANN